MSSSDTKLRLEEAVLATLREEGLAGVSARSVAVRADANQALIFYHYGSVAGLIQEAAQSSVTNAVGRYRTAFETVDTFGQLLAVGQHINAQERQAGNVAVMAQLVAGSHLDPVIGSCARACLDVWIAALEPTVARLLDASPLRGLVDHRGLVRAVSSAFIGLELYESVDSDGSAAAMSSIEQLADLLEAVDSLGPVAHRALRAHMRRRARRTSRTRH